MYDIKKYFPKCNLLEAKEVGQLLEEVYGECKVIEERDSIILFLENKPYTFRLFYYEPYWLFFLNKKNNGSQMDNSEDLFEYPILEKRFNNINIKYHSLDISTQKTFVDLLNFVTKACTDSKIIFDNITVDKNFCVVQIYIPVEDNDERICIFECGYNSSYGSWYSDLCYSDMKFLNDEIPGKLWDLYNKCSKYTDILNSTQSKDVCC